MSLAATMSAGGGASSFSDAADPAAHRSTRMRTTEHGSLATSAPARDGRVRAPRRDAKADDRHRVGVRRSGARQKWLRKARREGWLWPVVGKVTSGFGPRRAPIGRGRHVHRGADIACPWGETVRAPRRGRVVFVRKIPIYGRTVVIRHRHGWRSFIAHLGRVRTQPGRRIQQGEPVGRCGSSGWATGPHVHFELWRPGGRRIDPMPRLWGSLKLFRRAGLIRR